MRAVWVIALLAALAALGAFAARASRPAPAPPAKLAVMLSADLRGYLAPCGCSEHMLGGIDRAAAQLERAKAEVGAAVHVNGGDSLFGGPINDEAHAQQDQAKARTLLRIFASLDTAAMALGPRDLAQGKAFLAANKPPFPLLGQGIGPGFVVQPHAGIQLGVATGDAPAQLVTNVKAARAAGAEVVVALASFPLAQLLPAGPELARAGADLALVGHQLSDADGEDDRQVDAGLPVLQLSNRGKTIARMEIHREAGAPAGYSWVASDQGQRDELAQRDAEIESLKKRAHTAEGPLKAAIEKKIAEKQAQRDALAARRPEPPAGKSWLSVQLIPLSDDKPSSSGVHQLMEKMDADVAQLNLSWAKAHGKDCPAAKPGELAFVGTETCISCHAEPGEVWHGTGHSHAYATLEKVHKQYDLDCVRCHVVGTNAPGGVCRVDKVDGRNHVGCESCHGRGSAHADDPNVAMPIKKPGEQNCRVCHTPENSTAFDYATYLPKILGPGHGRPDGKR